MGSCIFIFLAQRVEGLHHISPLPRVNRDAVWTRLATPLASRAEIPQQPVKRLLVGVMVLPAGEIAKCGADAVGENTDKREVLFNKPGGRP